MAGGVIASMVIVRCFSQSAALSIAYKRIKKTEACVFVLARPGVLGVEDWPFFFLNVCCPLHLHKSVCVCVHVHVQERYVCGEVILTLCLCLFNSVFDPLWSTETGTNVTVFI